MLHNSHAHDGHSEGQRRAHTSPKAGPVADREVPLGPARRTPPEVHAWLDGELPESAVRRGDMVKDVEFWNRIGDEAERRRRLKTPAYVQQRIMEALPQTRPSVITPWYRREFVVTPGAGLAIAAGLVAAVALATALILGAL